MFLLDIICTVKYFKQDIFSANDALKCTICTHLSAMPTLIFLLHLVSVRAASKIRLYLAVGLCILHIPSLLKWNSIFSFSFCCWFFFLVMRLTFRLAFRLDQLAVWGRPIPSAWLLVLLGLPTPSSYITVDSLGRTWVTFRLAFRLSAGWWAYSVVLLSRPSADFFEGLWWPIPAQWKVKGFSWRYYS